MICLALGCCVLPGLLFIRNFQQIVMDENLCSAISQGDIERAQGWLNAVASVDARFDGSEHCLNYAIQDRNIKMIDFLIEKGVTVSEEQSEQIHWIRAQKAKQK